MSLRDGAGLGLEPEIRNSIQISILSHVIDRDLIPSAFIAAFRTCTGGKVESGARDDTSNHMLMWDAGVLTVKLNACPLLNNFNYWSS